VTGFVPSVNGLHFDNAFPAGPALSVDLGLATLKIGNAANGLCGGMVFAAMDYWVAGRLPPADTAPPAGGTPFFRYLVRRLVDSWAVPGGPLKYLALMSPLYPSRSRLMLDHEWPAVRASLDAGQPCPLGLVKLTSANPLDIGKNHQVLAYRYDLSETSLRLAVYDPNQADSDDVVIGLELADPTRAVSLTMFPDASAVPGVLCFFKVAYAPKTPVAP
jgi:hypothetical protein